MKIKTKQKINNFKGGLTNENEKRIYTERSVKKGTKTVLYITDLRKKKTKKETGNTIKKPVSSNNPYSWLESAIDYQSDPIGSFFMKSIR